MPSLLAFLRLRGKSAFESGVLETSKKCVDWGNEGKEPLKNAERERGTKIEEQEKQGKLSPRPVSPLAPRLSSLGFSLRTRLWSPSLS